MMINPFITMATHELGTEQHNLQIHSSMIPILSVTGVGRPCESSTKNSYLQFDVKQSALNQLTQIIMLWYFIYFLHTIYVYPGFTLVSF